MIIYFTTLEYVIEPIIGMIPEKKIILSLMFDELSANKCLNRTLHANAQRPTARKGHLYSNKMMGDAALKNGNIFNHCIQNKCVANNMSSTGTARCTTVQLYCTWTAAKHTPPPPPKKKKSPKNGQTIFRSISTHAVIHVQAQHTLGRIQHPSCFQNPVGQCLP